jgi:hypothetical protein
LTSTDGPALDIEHADGDLVEVQRSVHRGARAGLCEREWRNVDWFERGLTKEPAGLRPLRSQQTQPAVRHRRQLLDPIRGAVGRTSILRIAEKGEALIAEPVEVLQCLLGVRLFHARWRMSLQVSGRLQRLLAHRWPVLDGNPDILQNLPNTACHPLCRLARALTVNLDRDPGLGNPVW